MHGRHMQTRKPPAVKVLQLRMRNICSDTRLNSRQTVSSKKQGCTSLSSTRFGHTLTRSFAHGTSRCNPASKCLHCATRVCFVLYWSIKFGGEARHWIVSEGMLVAKSVIFHLRDPYICTTHHSEVGTKDKLRPICPSVFHGVVQTA